MSIHYEDFRNKYQIEEKIGRGVYTEIYKVKNIESKKLRAVKIIKLNEVKEDLENEIFENNVEEELNEYIKRLANEIKNMTICSFKNINSLKYYESFQTQNEFAIILELCDCSLTKYLKEKNEGFNVEEIKQLLNQLNNTFKIMREKNIVHRDLKPDNILIKYVTEDKKNYIAKICDYGISKLEKYTKLKTHIGTHVYMAPEIMTEEDNYNYKCDLWSLGIILYQLYFKETPFKGKTEIALYKEIETIGNKKLKTTGDKDLDDLINKLLEKNPKKRISWEEYFNHPFLFNKIENGNELVPIRAELDNIPSQKITLLIPPTSGPNHPATVFFINNPNINHNSSQFNYKTKNITITQKKYMVLYKGYKNESLCLTDPLKYNGIIKTKISDNSNLIWKLMKEEKMFSFLKTLNKYQKYNHFPMTRQLTKKDNLYNNYFSMKTKFPNDYNYMPETYILPKDLLIIKEKLKDLDLNDKTNLWQ